MLAKRSAGCVAVLLLVLQAVCLLSVGQADWPFIGPTGADETVLGQGDQLCVWSQPDPNTGLGDIWIAGGDGRLPINLTSTPNITEADPAISVGCQGGTWIAFASDRGSPGQFAIWVMNLDGTSARQVTFPPAGTTTSHVCPVWSARCSELLFLEATNLPPPALTTLCFVNLNGLAVRRVAIPNFNPWWGGGVVQMGSGTMAYIRASDPGWTRTAIRIGLNHHAWLYVIDHPQDGPPCMRSGQRAEDCGLEDIALAVRLSSDPSCHVHITSYAPVYLDTAFFSQSGCWNSQAGWLEFMFADTRRDDNSGGVIIMMSPVAR